MNNQPNKTAFSEILKNDNAKAKSNPTGIDASKFAEDIVVEQPEKKETKEEKAVRLKKEKKKKRRTRWLVFIALVCILAYANYTYEKIDSRGYHLQNDGYTILDSRGSGSNINLGMHVSSDIISHKASFAFMGGIADAFTIDCKEAGFITVRITKTVGDCKVLLVDRYDRDIICELTEEGEFRVSLHSGQFDVVVVGDKFMGNVKVIYDH